MGMTPADTPSSPSDYAAVTPHGRGPAAYDIQAPLMDSEITAAFGESVAEGGAGVLYPQGARQAARGGHPPAGRSTTVAGKDAKNVKRGTSDTGEQIARITALPAPTEREQSQWYFQRYVDHLPAAGEIVLFDRSW